MSQNVVELLSNAEDEGLISKAAMQALTVVDIGTQIQNALGIQAGDVSASEVVLITLLVDDSGSIRSAGNEQVIRDGCNMILDTLNKTKQVDNILMHTRYLNGEILYEYCPIEQAAKLNNSNYAGAGGTPLYDQTAIILGTVLAKAQEFSDLGVAVRSITVIITDGADIHSTKIRTPKTIAPIVADMLLQESHIIAAMGIDDGGSTDFTRVFREMGIEDQWILTPGNSQTEIRKAFQLVSQSAARASQGAQSFSRSALGGFGN